MIKQHSLFKASNGIEYFNFEDDFVEKNIRCIPMIVRFKMDAAGVKLKLSEWNLFSTAERIELAEKSCENETDVKEYKIHLATLVKKYTNNEATPLAIDKNPEWNELTSIPVALNEKADEFQWKIGLEKWQGLTNLQRFTLLKLCRPGHENKNFPKAMREFDLI